MSLRLYIAEKQAALPRDFEISLNLKNVIFEEREEDATYPVELPLEANRHIFGFVDRISIDAMAEYPARMFFGPYLLIEGYAYITAIEDGKIELYISTRKSDFWAVNKKVKLSTLDLGIEDAGDYQQFTAMLTRSVRGLCNFAAIPLYDPYIKELYPEVSFTIFNRTRKVGDAFEHVSEDNVFIPFPRLDYIIRKTFQAFGYIIPDTDILADDNFHEILIVNRRNPMLATNNPTGFRYNDHVPEISVTDFLLEIERKFGFNFIVNKNEKKVRIYRFSKDVHNNTIVVNMDDRIKKTWLHEDDAPRGFKFSDHALTGGDNLDHMLPTLYGSEDNTRSVDCISSPVGVHRFSEAFLKSWIMSISRTYKDSADYASQIATEFLLTIRRDSRVFFLTQDNYFPLGYAVPPYWVNPGNEYQLTWDCRLRPPGVLGELRITPAEGLFYRYHYERIKTMVEIKYEYEFDVIPDIAYIRDIVDIFTGNIIVRNHKFRVFQQEIIFGTDSVKKHTLKCYNL